MPESTVYTHNGNRWTEKDTFGKKGQGKGKHSEVKAFEGYQGVSDPILIVQDAFPCDQCDPKFIAFSKNKSILFSCDCR